MDDRRGPTRPGVLPGTVDHDHHRDDLDDFFDELGRAHHHIRHIDVDDELHRRTVHSTSDDCATCHHDEPVDDGGPFLDNFTALEHIHELFVDYHHPAPWGCILRGLLAAERLLWSPVRLRVVRRGSGRRPLR